MAHHPRSQPVANPPSLQSKPAPQLWSPQLVDELLYRQFVNGEDVSGVMPPTVAPAPPPLGLPESLRALNRYVNTGVPTKGATVSPTPTHRAAGTPRTPGAARRPNQPQPRTPTAAEKGQGSRPLPAPGVQDENSPTHSSSQLAGQRRPAGGDMPMPSPKAKANRAERRVAWPTHVPYDAQLKGQKRSVLQPVTMARLRAQEHVDPDWIFKQPTGDFPLTEIFSRYPAAAKLAKDMRGISGDWRQDTFTEVEELGYKESMGFAPGAPSQSSAVLDGVYTRTGN